MAEKRKSKKKVQVINPVKSPPRHPFLPTSHLQPTHKPSLYPKDPPNLTAKVTRGPKSKVKASVPVGDVTGDTSSQGRLQQRSRGREGGGPRGLRGA